MSEDTIEELPDSEAPKKKGGGGSSIVQILIVVVVISVINFTVAKFVLLPSLGSSGDHGSDDGHGGASASHAADPHEVSGHQKMHQYIFEPMTTNLHSPYKSRLIKVQFAGAGSNPQFEQICEENLAKLKDAAHGVLQELTLLDTQDPGVRNTIKTRLLTKFEEALSERVIQEIYITDMVIQ
jgi:flagellar basal body-associated protein FliL